MTSTALEQREVRELPQLDRAAHIAAADAWLKERLAEARKGAKRRKGEAEVVERAKFLSDLYDTEEAKADEACKPRDAAVYTIATLYRRRRGTNLAGAIGVNRSGLQKIKDRQAKNPPKPVENADQVLGELAEKAMLHITRARAVLHARDEAVRELAQYEGWSNTKIGDLINRDASLVSRIINKEVAA